MKLYKPTCSYVEYGGKNFYFIDNFKTLLKANDLLQDQEIIESDKIEGAFEIIFGIRLQNSPKLTIQDKKVLIKLFFEKWSEGKSASEKCFDFKQDAELIYSGFWQSYNIDLFNADLTIEQFLALFKGLPKNTKFCEVISIRTMPLPKPTKYNAEYRASIIKAKQAVKLESDKSNSTHPNNAIAKIVGALA